MYLSNRLGVPPSPRRRMIVVRGPNGVLRGLGFGDVPINGPLDQAKQALVNAGYAGAECRTETVYYPNGGGGSYTQNICSAPGYDGGFMADLATKMTPTQLAAQRAYELANGEGKLQDYFQATAGAPNIAIGATTGSAAGSSSTVPANWVSGLQTPVKTVATVPKVASPVPVVPVVANQSPHQAATPAGALQSLIGEASGSLGGFPIWALGLGALVLLPMVFGGRR